MARTRNTGAMTSRISRRRVTIAFVLQILAVLFSFYTWIDPLEGGVATTMVGLLTIAVWLIGRVRVPELTWISLVVTFAIAAVMIGIILAYLPVGAPAGAADDPEVRNVLSSMVTYLWVYRVGAVAVIAGAAFYAVTIWNARKATTS